MFDGPDATLRALLPPMLPPSSVVGVGVWPSLGFVAEGAGGGGGDGVGRGEGDGVVSGGIGDFGVDGRVVGGGGGGGNGVLVVVVAAVVVDDSGLSAE